MISRRMFSMQWILTTLLVWAGAAVCIRLGIWQLDRLAQRRAFNLHVEQMRAAPVLDLNQTLPADLLDMEWRSVKVRGTYDFTQQIALRNQYDDDVLGYHLITPLRFDGGAVFVDRGWIPADGDSKRVDWQHFDVPGEVTVSGQIRLSQPKPFFGGVADPPIDAANPHLDVWNNLNLALIASQIPYRIELICIQPAVDLADVTPPIPVQPELDLTEGPHLGYAVQWFTFAAIMFVGYPFYLRGQNS